MFTAFVSFANFYDRQPRNCKRKYLYNCLLHYFRRNICKHVIKNIEKEMFDIYKTMDDKQLLVTELRRIEESISVYEVFN